MTTCKVPNLMNTRQTDSNLASFSCSSWKSNHYLEIRFRPHPPHHDTLCRSLQRPTGRRPAGPSHVAARPPASSSRTPAEHSGDWCSLDPGQLENEGHTTTGSARHTTRRGEGKVMGNEHRELVVADAHENQCVLYLQSSLRCRNPFAAEL